MGEQSTRKPNTQNNDFYNEFGLGGDQTGPSGDAANVKYVIISLFQNLKMKLKVDEIGQTNLFSDLFWSETRKKEFIQRNSLDQIVLFIS